MDVMQRHANVIAVQQSLDAADARTAAGTASRVIVLDEAVHTAAAVFPISYPELVRVTAGTPAEVA